MTPYVIKYGDKKLKYSGKDGKSLKNGDLKEEIYIERNMIPTK